MEKIKIGKIIYAKEPIEINAGKTSLELIVTNNGDRPIQVGSHYHFFECNFALRFDREASYGRRLDIPAGTAVRFEPGEDTKVQLIEYSGEKKVMGFNKMTMGYIGDQQTKRQAFENLHKRESEGV